MIKASFLLAGGFGGTAVSLVTLSTGDPGREQTIRFAVALAAGVVAVALFLAAVYIFRRA